MKPEAKVVYRVELVLSSARLLVLSVCVLEGEGEHDSIYVELTRAHDEMLS